MLNCRPGLIKSFHINRARTQPNWHFQFIANTQPPLDPELISIIDYSAPTYNTGSFDTLERESLASVCSLKEKSRRCVGDCDPAELFLSSAKAK